MDIITSARHFDLTEAIKSLCESSVTAALADLTIKVSSVRITLDIQKNVHRCDMTAAVKGTETIQAGAETLGDMNKSIADAADKLRVQAKKFLEKKQDRRDRETLKDIDASKAEK